EALYVVQSIDGVNWSAPVEVLRGAGTMIVSPAIVHRDGVYHMWSIASITPRWRTEYRTAPSIYGPWSAPTECVMPMPDPKIDMWHVDVIDHRGRFVAIFSSSDRNQSGSGTNGKLFYAESFDGKQWNMAPTPFLEQGTAGSGTTTNSIGPALSQHRPGTTCITRRLAPMGTGASVAHRSRRRHEPPERRPRGHRRLPWPHHDPLTPDGAGVGAPRARRRRPE